ncbi:MAG: hypothetical protein FWG32_00120 [Oscillospiraceae bacterium]|nr:hypothetical protein [Oscillospiraceae bacterium]
MKNIKFFLLITGTVCAALLSVACGAPAAGRSHVTDSGDPAYEALTIQIEGLRELGGGIAEITVAELRTLPQYELAASYRRTTGLYEEFLMTGPLLKDVIAFAGGNLDDCAGLGMTGRDNYYCLFSREVIDDTPDLMIAVTVDGLAKLDDDKYPAWAAVQGQFGPYWVKQLEKIIMYEEIPEKNIKNVWVFAGLTEGIAGIEYEYYGSRDNAMDLEQIFSRLDYVDSKAFFTMKSSDGFKKNEAMNMVKSRYYIKTDGEDSPTNVAPYVKLGMNVRKIAWFSANADAVFFPYMLAEYMDTKTVKGETGIPLDELLYEVEIDTVKAAEFEIIGRSGERCRAPGSELKDAIMIPLPGGGAKVIWTESSDHPDTDDLLRIRLVEDK